MTHQTGHTAPGTPAGTLPAPSGQESQEAPRVPLIGSEFLTPERSAILDRLDEKHEAACEHGGNDSQNPAQSVHLPSLGS